MPPVPPPAAIPQVGPETSDYAAKMARRRSGFRKTVLAGGLEPFESGKKKVLG
jgi:hypothetical protein